MGPHHQAARALVTCEAYLANLEMVACSFLPLALMVAPPTAACAPQQNPPRASRSVPSACCEHARREIPVLASTTLRPNLLHGTTREREARVKVGDSFGQALFS